MRNTVAATMMALVFACSLARAEGMSAQDYRAAKKRIAAEYDAERQKCGVRHGNDLDLCVARAHGVRDVAKAELEATYKPSPRANYDAAIARSKAAYAIAKEGCDDRRGAAKQSCLQEARIARERAVDEAKSAMRAEGAAIR
jgi:hypothetical protein